MVEAGRSDRCGGPRQGTTDVAAGGDLGSGARSAHDFIQPVEVIISMNICGPGIAEDT